METDPIERMRIIFHSVFNYATDNHATDATACSLQYFHSNLFVETA